MVPSYFVRGRNKGIVLLFFIVFVNDKIDF